MTDPIIARARAAQPTAFELRTGLRPVGAKPHAPIKRQTRIPPPFDPSRNANNRSYRYQTAWDALCDARRGR